MCPLSLHSLYNIRHPPSSDSLRLWSPCCVSILIVLRDKLDLSYVSNAKSFIHLQQLNPSLITPTMLETEAAVQAWLWYFLITQLIFSFIKKMNKYALILCSLTQKISLQANVRTEPLRWTVMFLFRYETFLYSLKPIIYLFDASI